MSGSNQKSEEKEENYQPILPFNSKHQRHGKREFVSKKNELLWNYTNDKVTSENEIDKADVKRTKSDENRKTKPKIYKYGNYPSYYGYRNPMHSTDSRLKVLCKKYFYNLNILDIGCNSGFLTTEIALRYNPKFILGLDIDELLIEKADKHLKFTASLYRDEDLEKIGDDANFPVPYFPISMPLAFGNLQINDTNEKDFAFPNNCSFVHSDFMKSGITEMDSGRKYDTILALSLTKWIHLNHGDKGMKRFFYQIYHLLNPGGHFILEAQPFNSYAKRSTLTKAILENYTSIQFFPEDFDAFLIEKVGFVKVTQTLASDLKNNNTGKGFDRNVIIYFKP